MNDLENYLDARLIGRKQERNYRQVGKNNNQLVDFTSNDYLGLARSEELYYSVEKKLEQLSIKQNGATGSRLLSGNNAYTESVEEKLAEIFLAESALIINSGYTANVAVLSAIPQRGDMILYDERAHASLKDGARLSLAKRFSFRHNDLNDLELKLKNATGRKYIVVESIYSMDGDECPLSELVSLAEQYGAFIILDEAHSTGVVGKNGSGLAVALGVQDKIAVRIYTFGKAMGIHGACIVGTKIITQYMINFARPFIYTTALPPHAIASIDMAFAYLQQHIDLQETLAKNVVLFLESTRTILNRTSSRSAIQTALFPGNENVRRVADQLQQKGFDVRPILSPTVAEGAERLRICLHSFNTSDEITKLAVCLKECG